MDRSRMAALMVRGAYEKVIRDKYNRFIKTYIPFGPDSKMMNNAVAFWEQAARIKQPVDVLMREVFVYWDSAFCLKAFRTPWPPLSLALCEKTRNAIGKSVKVSKPAGPKSIEQYATILSAMDHKDALACVDAGWPEGPKHVRRELKERLLCQSK